MSTFDGAVVGSGPNGLAGAIRLAESGRSVVLYERASNLGGGLRSEELIEAGTVHDVCSAVHPFGLASPYLSSLPLETHGLRWIHPPVLAAHPLDNRASALLVRDAGMTAAGLGDDGPAWDRLVGWAAEHSDALFREVLQPALHVPRSPFVLGRFGIGALLPARTMAQRAFSTTEARALWAGLAAHTIAPLGYPVTSAIAILLAAAGHAVGWPIPEGGSQRLADAMVAHFQSLGGTIRSGVSIESLDEIETDGPVLFDTSPRALASIAGDALPSAFLDKLQGWKSGPGVFKIDYLLSEPVPWADEAVARAGTIHLGGTLEEIALSESDAWKGRVSTNPFVLATQPTQFDPSRSSTGRHVLWAYCHAPNGSTVDMTESIERQIERFAPGFGDCVVDRHTMHSLDFEARNPNYVGGDIGGGAANPLALLARPRLAVDPYATPNERLFLCSSSTPPGGGVHGMCGFYAAESALTR